MTWAEIQQSDDWKAFANSTVELIFKNLNSDAKRVQTWLIIDVLMEMYPQLDVYTHLMKDNGGGRTSIVFGRKNLQGNGNVCFELLQNNGNLLRLELGRIIDGIHHAEPTKPHCIFSLDDTKETITEKVNRLFSGFKDKINTYKTPNPNGKPSLPLNFETGVC